MSESIMSRDTRERPPLRFAQSSSSSLRGLEQVIPKKSPLSEIFKQPVESPLDKPLPPTPRKPSSLYTTEEEPTLDSYFERGPKDEILPSYIFISPTQSLIDYPEKPVGSLTRPKLQGDETEKTVSDSGQIKKWLNTPPLVTPRARSERETYTQLSTVESLEISRSHQRAKESTKMAEKRADEYRRALSSYPDDSIAFRTVEYEPEYFPEAPISARIVDVVDHSLVPSPLRLSRFEDNPRTSSQLYRNAPDTDTNRHGLRQSIRLSVGKAFRASKPSAEENEGHRALSVASAKYPQMSLQPPLWRERLSSVASQHRANMQQGLSSMYETVRRLSNGSSKLKPITVPPPRKRAAIPRELRSLAIPVTPYQTYGTKAWELAPKSPNSKPSKRKWPKTKPPKPESSKADSANKKRFPLLPKSLAQPIWQSMGGKGWERQSGKEKASEKRREELKKKIVVIGLADQYPDGRVNQWM